MFCVCVTSKLTMFELSMQNHPWIGRNLSSIILTACWAINQSRGCPAKSSKNRQVHLVHHVVMYGFVYSGSCLQGADWDWVDCQHRIPEYYMIYLASKCQSSTWRECYESSNLLYTPNVENNIQRAISLNAWFCTTHRYSQVVLNGDFDCR